MFLMGREDWSPENMYDKDDKQVTRGVEMKGSRIVRIYRKSTTTFEIPMGENPGDPLD